MTTPGCPRCEGWAEVPELLCADCRREHAELRLAAAELEADALREKEEAEKEQ